MRPWRRPQHLRFRRIGAADPLADAAAVDACLGAISLAVGTGRLLGDVRPGDRQSDQSDDQYDSEEILRLPA